MSKWSSIVALIFLPAVIAVGMTPQEVHDLRVKKMTRIVKTFYGYDGRASIEPFIEHFISEHERLEIEGLAKGYDVEGFGATWWWSAVYGGANFSLTCYGKAPGGCAGPMDVKHYPRVMDPKKNITWHVEEQFGFYKSGVRGIKLCYHVFLPANPRDWDIDKRGNGAFARTDIKHKKCIVRGYDVGKLP